MSEVKEQVKRAVVLNPQRIGLAEQMRQDWVVNAEEGTTVKDVLDPAYWSHIAAQLQQYDNIDVRLETGEWILKLVVLSSGRNYAHVYLDKKLDFAEVIVGQPSSAISHKVEFKGPQRKHVVIRLSDSASIQEGFATKAEAITWMENYIKVAGT